MEQVRYLISDAANIVAVESHVLRYWEDELGLTVPRNEMGHRYYTQENVDQFLRIKQLKEDGYQLKAIKIQLQQEQAQRSSNQVQLNQVQVQEQPVQEPMRMKPNQMEGQRFQSQEQIHMQRLQPYQEERPGHVTVQMTPQERMEQFQQMMTEIVRNAMSDNNKDLSHEIGTEVGDRVLKEMNYLMRVQDEQEEERFRKLDEAIRNYGKKQKRSIRKRKQGKQKLKAVPGVARIET
ncbi:MAG: MerR family transcriptional regulator [Eubacterium sp.]|nr:MerR family transcriptional regulator [Eubacterium sp.]